MADYTPKLLEPVDPARQNAATPDPAPRNLMASGDPVATPPLQPPQRDLMPVANETVSRPSFERPTGAMPQAYTTDVTENQTVVGQLKQLLAADSPYLEQGRQAGLAQMSQRGLQNSSFAMQAGEQGRIAAALPIAQQDANTYATQSRLNQTTINEFRTNEMDHMQSMIERAQQGDINAQLQLDQYGFTSALSAQENVQRLEQMAFAGDIDARNKYLDFSYASMMAGIQQGYALQLNDQQFQNSQALLTHEYAQRLGLTQEQSRLEIERMNAGHQNTLEEIAARYAAEGEQQGQNLGYQLQAQYLSQVAARQQAASEEIRIIMQTEGLSDRQQVNAVHSARERMRADIRALQAYYAKSPQWDDDFGAFVGGAPTPPGGTPYPNAPSPYDPTPGMPNRPIIQPNPGLDPGLVEDEIVPSGREMR